MTWVIETFGNNLSDKTIHTLSMLALHLICIHKYLICTHSTDTGIVAELAESDRENFLALFKAVVLDKGEEAGRLMINRSRADKTLVLDPRGFEVAMADVVREVHRDG